MYTSRPLSRNDRGSNNYQRKFNISVHALERFRERVDEEFRYRDDVDLGNLLDEKLKHPENKYTVRDPRAPEEVTQLFEIMLRRSGPYYVVVRNETAVTVLDPDMAQRNFAESWKPTLNTPFSDKLNAVSVKLAKSEDVKKTLKELQQQPSAFQPTPTDEAILRGDLQPSAPSTAEVYQPTPLEAAGAEYARTLKRCRDAEQAVERAKREVEEREAALQEAREQRDAAQQKLTTLAEGSE